MKRRDFLQLGGSAVLGAGMGRIAAGLQNPQAAGRGAFGGAAQAADQTDFTLTIAPVTVELAPTRVLSTIGYNGSAPGPILRMREGVPVTVEVINQTDTPEFVHWHGLNIPAEVDGVEEEGTPVVPPRGRQKYTFTPSPAGVRWYHTHTMSMDDLHRGSFTGQFGFLVVDGGPDPGNYDQELFLALRDWEPRFTWQPMDTDELDTAGPQPEKPAVLDTRPAGLEVEGGIYSFNDKALGAGDPVRVKPGDRVLFHFLNASAIENRRIALPHHQFQILALDGNPVPNPAPVNVLLIGPGERIDAIVEMNSPGVWILGAVEPDIRNNGLGVVIEYAGLRREPVWDLPWPPEPGDLKNWAWDYSLFGRAPESSAARAEAIPLEMAFEKIPRGAGKFNTFTVNGKPYPHDQEFVLKQGSRYRLLFRNRTDDSHPLHLHRHSFELLDINGKPTSGVRKDTVIVPYYGRTTVEFVADQTGPTLFHCHIQAHMDYGFKALLHCS